MHAPEHAQELCVVVLVVGPVSTGHFRGTKFRSMGNGSVQLGDTHTP